MGLLSTGITGLLSARSALETTGHNIANVNTEGFSRQELSFVARPAQFTGAGYLGKGVETSSVKRVYDEFVTTQLRTSTTNESYASQFHNLATGIDNMLADDTTGLSPSIQGFFNALQDVVDVPSSVPARQVMLGEAESLSARFHFLHARLGGISDELDTSMQSMVASINTISRGIADLNNSLRDAFGQSEIDAPNDLLDQRDQLVLELSEFIPVNMIEQPDGTANVFVGSGQALVLGPVASTVSLSQSYVGHYDIHVTDQFGTSNISDSITSGSLGGILDFQSDMLEPTRNSLGRLALGIADTFNQQHQLGMNLDGDINVNFFNIASPEVQVLGNSPATISAAITDTTQLSDSDYQLYNDGSDNFTLLRLTDGQSTTINTGGTYPFTSTAVDGFNVTITAAGTLGDQYIIQPTASGAEDFNLLVTDVNKISMASALSSITATGANGLNSNTGNAEISGVSIDSTTGLPLSTPVTLTFNSVLNQFALTGGATGSLAYDPVTESQGKVFTFATIGNASFTISGTPANGDQFIIDNNINVEGDNSNGLVLSNMQSDPVLLNGTTSYQDTYADIVVDVGTQTRQLEISSNALEALRVQALRTRESVSGVNLDEEAANMLKFQQAFQAAAQMISISDGLFQDLLNSFG